MDLSAFVDLAGAAATGILFLLVGLSVVQVAILVERGIVMYRSRAQRRQLRRLTDAIASSRLADAAEMLEDPRSLPESVLAAALPRSPDGSAAVEEVVRA